MPDKMNGENHSLVRLFLKSGFMKELDLTKGSVLKTLLQFAVPFLIANLLQALYGGADLFVVGVVRRCRQCCCRCHWQSGYADDYRDYFRTDHWYYGRYSYGNGCEKLLRCRDFYRYVHLPICFGRFVLDVDYGCFS